MEGKPILLTAYNDKDLLERLIQDFEKDGYKVFGNPLKVVYTDDDDLEYVFYGQAMIRNLN